MTVTSLALINPSFRIVVGVRTRPVPAHGIPDDVAAQRIGQAARVLRRVGIPGLISSSDRIF